MRVDDIEAIKQLRARYARAADTRDFDLLRTTVTDDFFCDTGPGGRGATTGVEAFIERVGTNPPVTVHHALMPEIELTSPTTARGIWASRLYSVLPDGSVVDGFGHHHDTYLKVDGAWRLQSLRLQWLHRETRGPGGGSRLNQAWLGEAVIQMRVDGKPGDIMREFNDALVAEYRASGGKAMGTFPPDKIGILTTKGARTGQERVVPIGFEEIDGRILVIASQGGLPTHPSWYYNLKADPNVTVEFKGDTWRGRALELEPEEREAVYSKLASNFQTYKEMIDGRREIPVFELQRVD
jgi:deazaflavin-dependent oxidoreductase (nitroreductase family)